MLSAGAHFVKIAGLNLDNLKELQSAPTFKFCPVFITGGMEVEHIPGAFAAGTVSVGTGFDLILKNTPNTLSLHDIERKVRHYLKVAQEARSKYMPHLQGLENLDHGTFFSSLTHYHPFTDKPSEIQKPLSQNMPIDSTSDIVISRK